MKYILIISCFLCGLLYADNLQERKEEALKKKSKILNAGSEEGKNRALNDLKNGIYRLEVYGKPAKYRKYYIQILKEKHNIIIDPVAGCIIRTMILNHAKEYNKIMVLEIKNKFGNDVLSKAQIDAENKIKTNP
ncbi:MAG: hypothetical protein HRT88_22900 [Lentisphaeraceae bacterium]|nr:hypothetical protein [Lentisphaeraceae bacterium]